MFNCERLTQKNIDMFRNLNSNRKFFNELNEDFFQYYDSAKIIKRFLLTNQVKLLESDSECIGYYWLERTRGKYYTLRAFNALNADLVFDAAEYMLTLLRKNIIISYECSKNNYNFLILEKLGFVREEGIIELSKELTVVESTLLPDLVTFEPFIKGKHEELRCKLQNSIFMNVDREPLNIDDIYYDVMQDYFMVDGSIFMKYKGGYIGYGQIILDASTPTIVNFGITKEYRAMGFGKVLLTQLLNILYNKGFKKVKLKVDADNYVAYKLYCKMGFKKVMESYKWSKTI